MSPALKALINNSPTLKALSKSFLTSVSNNKSEDLNEMNEDSSHNVLFDTIFESNIPKAPHISEHPVMKKNKINLKNQSNMPKLPAIKSTPRSQRSQTESPGLNRSQRKSLPKTSQTTVLPPINRPKRKLRINSQQHEQTINEESNRENYMKKYVTDHARILSSSQQRRDLESELSDRICSSNLFIIYSNKKKKF